MDTYGWKFKMDIPFMTTGERAMFKRIVDAGGISPFKLDVCRRPDCPNDVIKGKLYCSKDCMDKAEATAKALQGESDG